MRPPLTLQYYRWMKKKGISILQVIFVITMLSVAFLGICQILEHSSMPYKLKRFPDKYAVCEATRCREISPHKKMTAIGDNKYICDECYARADREADRIFGCEYSAERGDWIRDRLL